MSRSAAPAAMLDRAVDVRSTETEYQTRAAARRPEARRKLSVAVITGMTLWRRDRFGEVCRSDRLSSSQPTDSIDWLTPTEAPFGRAEPRQTRCTFRGRILARNDGADPHLGLRGEIRFKYPKSQCFSTVGDALAADLRPLSEVCAVDAEKARRGGSPPLPALPGRLGDTGAGAGRERIAGDW
jgi:hypothetical protein